MRVAVLGMLLLLSLPAAAQESPEAVYAKFHRALQAGDLAEMSRHATPAGAKELASLPPGQQKQTLELLRKVTPATYNILGRDPGPGDTMVLRLTGPGTNLITGKPETQYGIARMVKTGVAWKMDNVHWSDRPDAKPRERAAVGATPGKPQARVQVKAEPPKQAPRQDVVVHGAPVERKLGTAKPPCVYKPVMTQQDLENCK